MRKINKLTYDAFYNGVNFSLSNTIVQTVGSLTKIFLHGHCITKFDREKRMLYISNCGYMTKVTKDRLNILEGVSINQRKGVWYLNSKEWDGKEILVENI